MTDATDRRGSGHDSASTSLLIRAKSGYQTAWERLVRLYAPLVYSWCRRASLAPEDARDVGQDVMAAAAQGITRFRRDPETGSFGAWLRGITRKKVGDYF